MDTSKKTRLLVRITPEQFMDMQSFIPAGHRFADEKLTVDGVENLMVPIDPSFYKAVIFHYEDI